MYEELRRAGELGARVYYSLLVTPEFSEQDADRFDAMWKAHPDTPRLKTGIVKMFMDGVIETNTAFMIAPVRERAGDDRQAELHPRGLQSHRDDARPARLADHGARPRGRRRSHGARRLRARCGGEPGAGARTPPPDRAHRDDRSRRRATLRQAWRHRVDASRSAASSCRRRRHRRLAPRARARRRWAPGPATSVRSARRAAACGRASPRPADAWCSDPTGRSRRSMRLAASSASPTASRVLAAPTSGFR